MTQSVREADENGIVPIDAAFDRLSADQQAILITDPSTMASMLMYHIVPG